MDAPGSLASLAIENVLPRMTQNGETGVDLKEFHYFRKCPAEIRNMIYKLLLVSNRTLQIISLLGARRRGSGKNFAAIMLTDKATYQEARGWYYTLNTFAIGNNYWGSRYLANLHGFQQFMKVAPKPFLGMIRHIEINVCADKYLRNDGAEYFFNHAEREGEMLMSICRILVQHFRGLRTIVIKATSLGDRPLPSVVQGCLPTVNRGDWEVAGDALRMLLDGYRRGNNVYAGLNVNRLWWYEAGNIKWKQEPGEPNQLRPPTPPGKKAEREKSFAGYVEAHRPHLLNYKGKWKVWGVTDDSMGIFRRYDAMGLK
ncbi:hypothetical protein IFR05_011227 [Cadophora sp. M221]|nr:hypothetical protein IFR05_011227 [Cadophora sp. M221]